MQNYIQFVIVLLIYHGFEDQKPVECTTVKAQLALLDLFVPNHFISSIGNYNYKQRYYCTSKIKIRCTHIGIYTCSGIHN